RRSHSARRRGRGDDGAAWAHQGGDPGAPAATAASGNGQHQGVRRAVRPYLPPHPRGGERRHGAAGRDGSARMTGKSNTSWGRVAELSLPTLSVVAFIVLWEVIVRWRGVAPIFLPADPLM